MVIRPIRRAKPGKSLHDQIIGSLLPPIWLESGSLLDHSWHIKLLGETITIDFDRAISPWPGEKSLIHPDFERDLITAKLLIFCSLKPGPVGWNKAVLSVVATFRAYIYFVRWRIDRGVASNSLLSAVWFNEFDSSMKSGGRGGLVAYASRTQRVFEAFDRGELAFVLNERKAIASEPFSRLFGMNDIRAFPKASRLVIESLLRDRELQISRNRTQDLAPEISVPEVFAPDGQDCEIDALDTAVPEFEGRLTLQAARIYYKVWFELWHLRDYLLHDVIGFRAFKTKKSLSRHLKKGKFPEAKRTEDAPAFQTSFLINAALSLILDPISDAVIDTIEKLAQTNFILGHNLVAKFNTQLNELGFQSLACVYEKPRRGGNHDLLSLHEFVFMVLPATARIVMAAFSARRDDEIKKTPIDCIETDSHGDLWLHCLINKNLNRMDRIPIPASVARAVAVVTRIRALGNKASTQLFDFSCPILKRPVKFDLSAIMDKIRDFFGVPLMDDGSAWHFTPHQFRKFFGVTYYWRWAFPNLTALTLQYRHFNPETTRAYIEMKEAEALRMYDEKLAAAGRNADIERKSDFDNGKREFALWVLKGVAAGEKLDGAMGRRINEMVDVLKMEFLPELQITQANTDGITFDKALEELVDSISLTNHPEGHSLCGMGSKLDDMRHQQRVSQCLQLRQRLTGQPASCAFSSDTAYAEDTACAVCALRAKLPSMTPYWDHEAQKAKEALDFENGDKAVRIRERVNIISEFA